MGGCTEAGTMRCWRRWPDERELLPNPRHQADRAPGRHVRGHGAMTLPELHLVDWRDTKDTLHLYSQILGKIRLAATAPRNHWWNVPLYVDVRGLTTRRLHHRQTTFEIAIDFVDHALIVRTADGRTKSFQLGSGLPVADFDARLHAMLGELDI